MGRTTPANWTSRDGTSRDSANIAPLSGKYKDLTKVNTHTVRQEWLQQNLETSEPDWLSKYSRGRLTSNSVKSRTLKTIQGIISHATFLAITWQPSGWIAAAISLLFWIQKTKQICKARVFALDWRINAETILQPASIKIWSVKPAKALHGHSPSLRWNFSVGFSRQKVEIPDSKTPAPIQNHQYPSQTRWKRSQHSCSHRETLHRSTSTRKYKGAWALWYANYIGIEKSRKLTPAWT